VNPAIDKTRGAIVTTFLTVVAATKFSERDEYILVARLLHFSPIFPRIYEGRFFPARISTTVRA